MKTKRMLMLILLLVAVSLAREAQAFYNPSIGRWLSRDPAQEQGGNNLFGFVRNNPVSLIDRLGLMHVRFEVVTGNRLMGIPTQAAGKWSQPYWAGDGDSLITSHSAWSMVKLNNEASWQDAFHWTPDYCNTVWVYDPNMPDHVAPGHAGEIRVYAVPDASDDCASATYQFLLIYTASLSGSGPAPVYATAYLFSGNMKPLSRSSATQFSPYVQAFAFVPVTATIVGRHEQLIAIYQPLLGFRNRDAYGGSPSYGTAEGTLFVGDPIRIK